MLIINALQWKIQIAYSRYLLKYLEMTFSENTSADDFRFWLGLCHVSSLL